MRKYLCVGFVSATIVAMSTESLREVRDHFSEVVDRVEHEHDRVTVTRNGRPAAVILSPDDLAQLEETLEILGDPELGKKLGRSGKEYVRTHFLMPRLLRDWLALFNLLAGNDIGETRLVTAPTRAA